MATTLAEIAEQLKELEILYSAEEKRILLSFATDLYADSDAERGVTLVLWLEEDGEFLRVHARGAYTIPAEASTEVRYAVLRTIAQLNWESKVTQYEVDWNDGEIRVMADLPLEDAKPTLRQLERHIRSLPTMLDQGHHAIRDALDHGIPMPTEAEIERRFDAYLRELLPEA